MTADTNARAGRQAPGTALMPLLARIRARSDGGLALWWWTGIVCGRRPDDLPRRLLRIEGIGFNRLAKDAAGLWQFAMSEAGYYCSDADGAFIDEWDNPYNGRRVRPRHIKMITRYTIGEDGIIHPPMPGVPFEGRVGPVIRQDEDVWVAEQLAARFPAAPGGGPTGNPVEMSTFRARDADLNAADAEVPATMDHQSVWGFYPWMEMEGQAGEVVTHIIGRKLVSAEQLPVRLRRRIETDHPGLLAAPGI